MNKSIGCVSISVVNPELTDIKVIRLLTVILSVVFFAIGLLSIFMFIMVIKRMTTLTSEIKFYVLSLNIANCLRLVALIIAIFNTLLRTWRFPAFMCPLLPVVGTMTVTASTWTVVYMLLELLTKIRSLNRVSRTQIAKYQIGSAWIIGAILSLPLLLVVGVKRDDRICGQFCSQQWNWIRLALGIPSEYNIFRPLYGCTVFAYQTAVPFVISTLTIWGIHRELKGTEQQLESNTRPTAAAANSIQRLLLWQAIALFVSATPIGAINMLDDLNVFAKALSIHRFLVLSCGLISLLTPTFDFLVYCIFNDNFREQTSLVVCWIRQRNRDNQPQQNPERIEMHAM